MLLRRVIVRVLLFAAPVFAMVFASRSSDTRLPEPMLQSSVAPVPAERCRECHREIWDSFQTVPHSQTLTPASRPEIVRKLLGSSVTLDGDVCQFEWQADRLWFQSDHYPQPISVAWAFGSGHHAVTPVSIWENPSGQSELIQLKASWYPDHGLASTLGFEHAGQQATSVPSLGTSQSAAETIRCFGCHTTYLPQEHGRIDFQNMTAGVWCSRCHLNSREHVAAAELGQSVPNSWATASPLTSINRCGECHRRVDEFPPDVLVPTDRELARFAPVGLALSRCFREQSASADKSGSAQRLDCLTCHDPHRPAESDHQYYVAKCLNCHNSRPGSAADCTAQAMTSNCIPCHLPKIEVQPHLRFTDHWIRIRGEP